MGMTILRNVVLVRWMFVRRGHAFCIIWGVLPNLGMQYRMKMNTKIIQQYLPVLFIIVLSFLPILFHEIT